MNKTIGFIGCGNMAQAIIGGILQSQLVSRSQIIASAKTVNTVSKVEETFGIRAVTDNCSVVRDADIIFLSIKPDHYLEIIQEIKEAVKEEAVIVTIAAGITLDWMVEQFQKQVKVVRTMPNTPSLVGEGMTAFCVNQYVEETDLHTIIEILESFGKSQLVEENLMDAIPAVSGSSPAYVFMFIEALADGAVLQGVPREKAYTLASQAVLGAAKMVLETGEHPGVLKDGVCSPGGATIEAVSSLEKNQFRGAILKAMEECTKKTKQLAQQ
ncbi:pyrroline-5-carboxylate reductase [Bacillus seohaeanensis]|jgi:pyrroline-5-carboxylate reductase|uniref:Pyrroline-5-carboxylate reductase n=1 Tax=Bacillus seohaeanensis TaxID=284580 RepID=A0ABW5RYI0_9BACI